MSSLPPLLKAQFDEGLRLRRPKPTQDFYKHIYVNSNERNNQSDLSSNCEVFLKQPIEIPPDGTTYIKLHRASVPYTFNNIVYPVGFKISLVALAGGAESDVRYVVLPRGFYVMNDLVTTMNNCLANAGIFATTGPNRDNANAALATIYTVARSGSYFLVNYTGASGSGKYVRITFLTYSAFLAAIASTSTGAIASSVETTFMANTWPGNIRDNEFKTLSKRTVGFDNLTQSDVSAAATAASATLLSPGIFGPFQEYEIFLRISGLPINYDLIDAHTGAPSDILAVIPLNVDTFGSVMTLKSEDSLRYVVPPNSRVQRLTLKLTYRDGAELVDLMGQDFSCILSIIKENSDGA